MTIIVSNVPSKGSVGWLQWVDALRDHLRLKTSVDSAMNAVGQDW